MIFDTLLPMDTVLEGLENSAVSYSEIKYNGVPLQVEMMSSQQARVVRVLSMDPRHFLDGRLAPGTVIEFYP